MTHGGGGGAEAKITLKGKLTKKKRDTEHYYSGHVCKIKLKGKPTKEKRETEHYFTLDTWPFFTLRCFLFFFFLLLLGVFFFKL